MGKNEHSVLDQEVVHIALTEADDGFFVADCVDIPGCVSQGSTREEALANIDDAISACLHVMTVDLLHGMRQRQNQTISPEVHRRRVSVRKPTISPA